MVNNKNKKQTFDKIDNMFLASASVCYPQQHRNMLNNNDFNWVKNSEFYTRPATVDFKTNIEDKVVKMNTLEINAYLKEEKEKLDIYTQMNNNTYILKIYTQENNNIVYKDFSFCDNNMYFEIRYDKKYVLYTTSSVFLEKLNDNFGIPNKKGGYKYICDRKYFTNGSHFCEESHKCIFDNYDKLKELHKKNDIVGIYKLFLEKTSNPINLMSNVCILSDHFANVINKSDDTRCPLLADFIFNLTSTSHKIDFAYRLLNNILKQIDPTKQIILMNMCVEFQVALSKNDQK